MREVVKNFDIRVIEGYELRQRLVKHINKSFAALDELYEVHKKNPICPGEHELLWRQINDELALLEGIGLLRKSAADSLHEKLDSYV